MKEYITLKEGDLIIIDSSLEPRDNDKVLACEDGELIIKNVSVDRESHNVWIVDDKKIKLEEENLVVLRGKQVLFDMDVAEVYGVTTRQVNEAIKNNPDKFSEEKGYIIRLTEREFKDLRSKFTTAKWSKRRTLPNAITEKGIYKLGTILKSPEAEEATFAIIEKFAKLRELARNIERLNDETIPEDETKSLTEKTGKMLKEIVTDPLPLKMRKVMVSKNFGIFKISVEKVREKGKEGAEGQA